MVGQRFFLLLSTSSSEVKANHDCFIQQLQFYKLGLGWPNWNLRHSGKLKGGPNYLACWQNCMSPCRLLASKAAKHLYCIKPCVYIVNFSVLRRQMWVAFLRLRHKHLVIRTNQVFLILIFGLYLPVFIIFASPACIVSCYSMLYYQNINKKFPN